MGEDLISFKVSAPGKVILHGEHSVVYGKTAVAASLGISTTVTVQERLPTEELHLSVELPNVFFMISFSIRDLNQRLFDIPVLEKCETLNWENPSEIHHEEYLKRIHTFLKEHEEKYEIEMNDVQFQAMAIVLYLFCGILMNNDFKMSLYLKVDSDLTIGAGTGSSASFAVSLAAAMYQYLKLTDVATYSSCNKETEEKVDEVNLKTFSHKEKNIISEWAFCAEKIAHGNPSGIDNATCTFGSLVQFKKGASPILHPLNLKLRILLVDTRVSRQTRDLVQKVVDLRARCPEVVDCIMETLNQVALTALKVLNKMNAIESTTEGSSLEDNYAQLSELFEINHKLLTSLDVSHQSLEKVRAISAKFGFSCKLTGAGGGGFAIVLVPLHVSEDKIHKLVQSLNGSGFNAKLTEIGGAGVTIS